MNIRITLVSLLLLIIPYWMNYIQGQISGIVIDRKGFPIPYANVSVLSAGDSLFVKGGVADSTGHFQITDMEPDKPYMLRLSSVGYKTVHYPYIAERERIYLMEEDNLLLDEVIVKAETPQVRVIDGRLSFPVQTLVKNKPVTNAFDLLGEVPGLDKSGDRISIIGAPSTSIIINGKKSSMSAEQIKQMLKSMPANRVKSIEILYVTPTSFGVRGASVNVVLDRSSEEKGCRGEFYSSISQSYKLSPSAGASLVFSREKTSIDINYEFRRKGNYTKEDLYSVHTLTEGTSSPATFIIEQDNKGESFNHAHRIRCALFHSFSTKHTLDLSYYTSINRTDSHRKGAVAIENVGMTHSDNDLSGNSYLHVVSADYMLSTLSAGGDFLIYKQRNTQQQSNRGQQMYTINGRAFQSVHQSNFYLTNKSKLFRNASLTYGVRVLISCAENTNTTERDRISIENINQTQSEIMLEIFNDWSYSFLKKGTLSAGISCQHHKAMTNPDGKILWNRNTWYPTLGFTWRFSPTHVLQLSFSNEKRYPSYWQQTPTTTYRSSYVSIAGNPQLKPSDDYMFRTVYIFRSKYIFQLFGTRSVRNIRQTLVQSPDQLQAVYRVSNLDYHDTYGFLIITPFMIGKHLSSRVILSGFNVIDKGQIAHVSFDRHIWAGQIRLNNTLNISKTLSMQINGYFISKAIQGIYTIDPIYDLSVGILWKPAKKWDIHLNSEDLLKGRRQGVRVDEGGQYYKLNMDNDTRFVSLSVKYTFGAFKARNRENIETSRLGL